MSVLFCDLVGFTAASEAADPEDVRARVRPYHARLRRSRGLRRHCREVHRGRRHGRLRCTRRARGRRRTRRPRRPWHPGAIDELNAEDPALRAGADRDQHGRGSRRSWRASRGGRGDRDGRRRQYRLPFAGRCAGERDRGLGADVSRDRARLRLRGARAGAREGEDGPLSFSARSRRAPASARTSPAPTPPRSSAASSRSRCCSASSSAPRSSAPASW